MKFGLSLICFSIYQVHAKSSLLFKEVWNLYEALHFLKRNETCKIKEIRVVISVADELEEACSLLSLMSTENHLLMLFIFSVQMGRFGTLFYQVGSVKTKSIP